MELQILQNKAYPQTTIKTLLSQGAVVILKHLLYRAYQYESRHQIPALIKLNPSHLLHNPFACSYIQLLENRLEDMNAFFEKGDAAKLILTYMKGLNNRSLQFEDKDILPYYSKAMGFLHKTMKARLY